MTQLVDSFGRVLRDLRISVTDRCNYRCLYCLPETEAAQNFYRGHWAQLQAPTPIARQWQPRANLLTFEEIERLARLAAGLGITKLRLTGGEPLLRQQVERLVERLAAIPGIADLAMTCNGFLFRQQGRALRDAGLQRVSFSLDSLEPENFKKITGRDALTQVLESIAFARELKLEPVKINAVIISGLNDHELEALADYARRHALSLRFIEFMPLDSGRAWQRELVVPGAEIRARLQARFGLVPLPAANPSETASRWRYADGQGEVGIIASVTEPFCGQCNRLRLTADGKLRTCLFSVKEHDVRDRLRGGWTDDQLRAYFQEVVWRKEKGHRIGQPEFEPPGRTMSCIGG